MTISPKDFELLMTEVDDLANDFGVGNDRGFPSRARDLVSRWIDRQTKAAEAVLREREEELDRKRVAIEGLVAQRDVEARNALRFGQEAANLRAKNEELEERLVAVITDRDATEANLATAESELALSRGMTAEAINQREEARAQAASALDEIEKLEDRLAAAEESRDAALATAARRASYVDQWRDKFRAMRDERDQAVEARRHSDQGRIGLCDEIERLRGDRG